MHNIKHEEEATIRARAHQFWEDEGQPEGRDKIHWQRALEAMSVPTLMPATAEHDETKSDITDVTLIDGIGPKISAMLHEEHITTLQHIADMSEHDMAELDEKLDLRGRSAREEWILQAKELIGGHAPRAKIDQEQHESL